MLYYYDDKTSPISKFLMRIEQSYTKIYADNNTVHLIKNCYKTTYSSVTNKLQWFIQTLVVEYLYMLSAEHVSPFSDTFFNFMLVKEADR